MTINERIAHFLTSRGISASQFADVIGVQRSSISHILSGRNKPSSDFIQKLLKGFPAINAEWLLLGIGTMLKNSDKDNTSENKIDRDRNLFEYTSVNNTNKTHSSDIANSEPVVKSDISNSSTNDQEKSQNLHNESYLPENKDSKSNLKEIEKIVIFYTDKTFEVFNPPV